MGQIPGLTVSWGDHSVRWGSSGAFDSELWDMVYKGRRELADLSREGRRCAMPCTSSSFDKHIQYRPRQRCPYTTLHPASPPACSPSSMAGRTGRSR